MIQKYYIAAKFVTATAKFVTARFVRFATATATASARFVTARFVTARFPIVTETECAITVALQSEFENNLKLLIQNTSNNY